MTLPYSDRFYWYGADIITAEYDGLCWTSQAVPYFMEPTLLIGVGVIPQDRNYLDGKKLGVLEINQPSANRIIFRAPVISLARAHMRLERAEEYFNARPIWFLADDLVQYVRREPTRQGLSALEGYVNGLRREWVQFVAEAGGLIAAPTLFMPYENVDLTTLGASLPFELELHFLRGIPLEPGRRTQLDTQAIQAELVSIADALEAHRDRLEDLLGGQRARIDDLREEVDRLREDVDKIG